MDELYSDIDLNFTKHPITNDIPRLTGERAVRRSIQNLIMSNFYEWPYQHEKGTSVNALLFENMSDFVSNSIQREIQSVIGNYEPRVSNFTIDVLPILEKNGYEITIEAFIESIDSSQPLTIRTFLQRAR